MRSIRGLIQEFNVYRWAGRMLLDAARPRRTWAEGRNRHGLLFEHIDPHTRELSGDFPQTYNMVGLINSGMRSSIPWDQAF